jgi:heme/copper-type cytochrome/quinol oxidase subunit 2
MKARLVILVPLLASSLGWAQAPRTIQVIANKDNTFKVVGQKKPVIQVKPSEVIKLKITSFKGGEQDKDGAVHSLTIKQLKDLGWDIRLYPGTKEYTLVAPDQPGEYVIECTVKCGDGHDDMKANLVVAP